ncbi:non-specific lipid transfer protein GPI-anchored 5 isoform X2 [Lathyrus oleraceus]|nr:non-specific lipid transfer protein GPI-anchored 5-like isoform X2 [Pisum sativum]
MAFRSTMILLSMFFVAVSLWGVTVAQTDSSCTNVFISLSPCLEYITEQTSSPSGGCCSQLASVMGSQPQCLCEVVNGGAASSIAASFNINQTRALALPTTCNVQTPPINTCTASSSSPPVGISVSNIPNSPSGSFSSTTGSSESIRGSSSSYRTSSSSGKLQCSLLVLVIFAKFTFILMTTT